MCLGTSQVNNPVGEGGGGIMVYRPPDFMDFMDGHFLENSENIFSSYLFLLFWVDKQLRKFGVQSGSQADFLVPIAHSWPVPAPFLWVKSSKVRGSFGF